MATYQELTTLFNNDVLRAKVKAAVIIAAYGLYTGSPTAADRAFADQVFANPVNVSQKVLMAVLAANKDTALGSITTATDSAIQTNVDAVIPEFVQALAEA